jgi:hypothetical protein
MKTSSSSLSSLWIDSPFTETRIRKAVSENAVEVYATLLLLKNELNRENLDEINVNALLFTIEKSLKNINEIASAK